MRNILFIIAILTNSLILSSQNETELETSLLKINLPKTNSNVVESSKIEKEDYYIFRFFFSATVKENSELYGNTVRYQPLYSSYMFSLCETLRNCENQTFKFAEDVKKNDFLKQESRYYEDSKKDYDVVLYFDGELDLKLVEKVVRTFDNTKKMDNIYLAYTNNEESKTILLYNFNPKSNYIFNTSNNEKYNDWVESDFRVQYGEIITIAED